MVNSGFPLLSTTYDHSLKYISVYIVVLFYLKIIIIIKTKRKEKKEKTLWTIYFLINLILKKIICKVYQFESKTVLYACLRNFILDLYMKDLISIYYDNGFRHAHYFINFKFCWEKTNIFSNFVFTVLLNIFPLWSRPFKIWLD